MSMIEKIARSVHDIYAAGDEPLSEIAYEAARSALAALREPTNEMMAAAYEAMFDDKWNGTQAPMMGAAFEAAIDAALRANGQDAPN